MSLVPSKSYSSLVPSTQVFTDCRLTIHNEYGIPHPLWDVYVGVYVQNLDVRDLWHTYKNKNPNFFRDYWTTSDGVFAEMQIIRYIFIILKHIQVSSQFRNLLMLKVRLSFFGTICIMIELLIEPLVIRHVQPFVRFDKYIFCWIAIMLLFN